MKSRLFWIAALTAVAALALAFSVFSRYYVELLWFESQGQADAFWTTARARWGFFLAGALLVWLAALLGYLLAVWRRRRYILLNRGEGGHALFHVAAAVLGIALGGPLAQSQWQLWSLAFLAPETGVIDPVHGLDASVYMFHLPLYRSLLQNAAILLGVALLFSAAAYVAPLRQQPGRWNWHSVERALFFALPQLSINGAGLLIVAGLAALLARFGAVVEGSAEGIAGASYVDVYFRLPAYFFVAGTCFVGALALGLAGFVRSWRPPAFVLAAIALIALTALQLYPGLIYFTDVYSSEAVVQAPFVRRTTEFTRRGFGLWALRLGRLPSAGGFGDAALRSQLTLESAPLWSRREARQAFRQQQSWRPYYDFLDVDVLRYRIDGQLRQLLIAPRELNRGQLPDGFRNWEGRRLRFTHSYGVVMAPVSRSAADGSPEYWLRDLPPSLARPGLPGIRRPAIYFGEAPDDYAIVRTGLPEFAYPVDDSYAETVYEGKGGVLIGAGLRRFLIATHFDFWKILFSDYIGPDSRILFHREIRGAVQKIAPFLILDHDPYLVAADDGRLYWILDAYTASAGFPYSTPVDGLISAALPQQEQRLRSTFGAFNYVRNSVKVIIDAYDGIVRLYHFDRNDPHLRAWAKIYPEMFRPLKEMPVSLRARLRHPRDLFLLQAAVYATHHSEDAADFLSGEDRWTIGTELVQGVQQSMDARYSVVVLPEESAAEYVISIPLVSPRRQTILAWLAARCDYIEGPQNRFGELLVFQALRGQAPPGPIQVEGRIEQNPDIAREMAEWTRQGARVLRGQLSVVPTADGLLYVEPIYVQGAKAAAPELRRVAASDGVSLGYSDNLSDALLNLAALSQRGPQFPGAESQDLRSLATRALTAMKRAQAAAGGGDWVEYGRQMTELQTILNRIAAQ